MSELADMDTAVRQIESLLDGLAETDPELRAKSEQIIELLLRVYGAGLARMMQILREAGAEEALGRLARDKLVASLLLLHGLHPEEAEKRIQSALRRVERGLESHHLVLDGIVDGVARIRVERNGSGAPPPALAGAIERAVLEWAPDLAGVEIDGVAPAATPLVQIELATGR